MKATWRIVLLVSIFGYASASTAEPACQFEADHRVLNFSSLQPSPHWMSRNNKSEFEYVVIWSPCQERAIQKCSSHDPVENCTLLSARKDAFVSTNGENLYLYYRSSSAHIRISLNCQGSLVNFEKDSTKPFCMFDYCFAFTHPFCCFHTSPSPETPSDQSAVIILLTSLVMITCVMAATIVVLVTMQYLRRTKGATLCPFVEISRTLPFVLEDGISYVIRCKKKRNRAAYERI